MVLIVRRGSSFFGRITVRDKEHGRVRLTGDEKLVFTVRRTLENDPEPVIRCVMTPGDELEGGYVFMLTPEETDIPAGRYYYDIAVVGDNGGFYHITEPDELIVRQTISRKDDNE